MKTYRITSVVLYVFIIISALALVYVKHKSREVVVGLQILQYQQQAMESEASHLILEQSALLSHSKVDRVARTRLHMYMPEQKDIVILK